MKGQTEMNQETKARKYAFYIDDKHEEAYWILHQMELKFGANTSDLLCHLIIDNFNKEDILPEIPRLERVRKRMSIDDAAGSGIRQIFTKKQT